MAVADFPAVAARLRAILRPYGDRLLWQADPDARRAGPGSARADPQYAASVRIAAAIFSGVIRNASSRLSA